MCLVLVVIVFSILVWLLWQRKTGSVTNNIVNQQQSNRAEQAVVPACSDAQILKWDSASGAWLCANESGVSYVAGAGLSLNGSTLSLGSLIDVFKTVNTSLGTSLSADSLTDSLTLSGDDGLDVTGDASTDTVTFGLKLASGGGAVVSDTGLSLLNTCANSQLLKLNSAGGAWECADDISTNTTYTAGTGLSLAGTTFGLDSSVDIFKTIITSWVLIRLPIAFLMA